MQKTSVSLAEHAYKNMKNDILRGAYEPGQPLRLEHLRERYGLSYSPLREALVRLAADRLVSQSSLRGFRIAEFSREEMWDLLHTRSLIDAEALRLAIEKGGNEWEAQIVGAMHALSRELENGNPEKFEISHAKFHMALISGCESPSLLHLSNQYYHLCERYRRPHLMAGMVATSEAPDILAEHEKLRDLTIHRRSREAAEALRNHYLKTGTFVENAMKKRGSQRQVSSLLD